MGEAVQRPRSIFGRILQPLQQFLELEASSGIVLLACAAGALAWANLSPGSYEDAFELPLAVGFARTSFVFATRELINDGLMTIFFFVVGLEIKRELAIGELNSVPKAILPAVAAIGGMVAPALIFLAFTHGTPAARGWGIPMATDIAFCVGVLTVLGDRVPRALVVFVTALAIFDDIGGIIVIALFYGSGVTLPWLGVALAVAVLLFALNRAAVRSALAYLLGGVALWIAFHEGGIHPAIAGVVTGLMVPARLRRSACDVVADLRAHVAGLNANDEQLDAAEIQNIEDALEHAQPPLDRFVHTLHPYVAYGVMPLFALANAGVTLRMSSVLAPIALGSALGLFVGKQLGIFSLTALTARLGLAPMPGRAPASKLYGVSVIAGIGFTVALFIASLAYPDAPELLDEAKLGIVAGSLASGVAGYTVLRLTGAGGKWRAQQDSNLRPSDS